MTIANRVILVLAYVAAVIAAYEMRHSRPQSACYALTEPPPGCTRSLHSTCNLSPGCWRRTEVTP